MTRRLLTFVTTTIFLLLIGALAGLLIAVLGLALASAFKSLQSSDGVGLLSFLVDLFFLLIDVLAVSTIAAPDGIWAGLMSAAAVSLTYGLVFWLRPSIQSNRWVLALIFAIVGALAAALSLRSVLADYGAAAAVVGALFWSSGESCREQTPTNPRLNANFCRQELTYQQIWPCTPSSKFRDFEEGCVPKFFVTNKAAERPLPSPGQARSAPAA